jgi:glycerol kinase
VSVVGRAADLYLAIDQGGHASRACVFDARGDEHAAANVPVETQREGQDRVEHDADALFDSVREAIAAAVAQLGAGRRRVRAAGIATQRSSIVCWDRHTGAALSPVISWQDRRAAGTIAALAPHAGRVHSITGLVLSAHYGASKLRWCLDHLDAVRDAHAAGHLASGPLASFLLFRLAEERTLHADPCNASRTLLWDLGSRTWSTELLELFGVPPAALPPCGPNAGTLGTLDVTGSRIPITVCTGDQPAALYAFGAPPPDVASVNAGTGAFIQYSTGAKPVRVPGLLTSIVWDFATSRRYVVEGTVNGAGSALDWAARTLGIDVASLVGNLEEWSRSIREPPLFLNGISGLGAPYWVSDFPSRFEGEGAPEARVVAVLESIAFLIRRNLDAMRAGGLAPARIRLTGGLAASGAFTKTLADLCRLAVERPPAIEATARGLGFLLASEPEDWRVSPDRVPLVPERNAALHGRYARWLAAMEAEIGRVRA